MAVLGSSGQLRLRREAPDACIISGESVNAGLDTIESICPGYWTGDRVSINCLPALIPGSLPGNPDNWASYQESKWFVGPNRDHIANDGDYFYKRGSEYFPTGQIGDAAQFYARPGDEQDGDKIKGCVPGDYWIHIDALGKVSFYKSRCAALAGCAGDRVDLVAVGGEFVIAPYGSLEYQNATWSCYAAAKGNYTFSDVADSITLVSICADAPAYQQPEANANTEDYAYDNANVLPRNERQQAPFWECIAELREWQLELDGPSVDCTSVSEKWGNAVKSLVSGGGSTEFFIDRKCFDDGTTNGTALMQLLLMTTKGCKAEAQFYMLQRPGECGADTCTGLITGDLYYECEILITQTAVNVRPTELVVGTAQFVTTGEIALREVAPVI